MTGQVDVQMMLREQFAMCKGKNPSYSLRSFSQKTGLSPATLSLVFNGKRRISAKLVGQIMSRLAIDPAEQQKLLDSLNPRTVVTVRKGNAFFIEYYKICVI